MLFNSIEFLAFFLPVTFAFFHIIRRYYPTALMPWLTVMSLFFYGWWEPRYLILLVCSVSVNFCLGLLLSKSVARVQRKVLLILGICWNLGLLGFYKYAAFVVSNFSTLLGLQLDPPSIVLPLAISFFSFQQIAYLVDVHKDGDAETSPLKYLLFVAFFPQLIAGPIVHHKKLLPQLTTLEHVFDRSLIAPALTLIILGLSKKVLMADSLALFSEPGFTLAEGQQALQFTDAWLSITAYTLQIYFDFSGYCDIALGCALLFGVRLPINFQSPYQSSSIIDYWRRWHVTLSEFLRDYIYIPLGGSRRGKPRWYFNLFITMFLGGIWHGAGWTFLIWGSIHGTYLMINHLWRSLSSNWPAFRASVGWRIFATLLTFLSVLCAFVIFRAKDMGAASYFLTTMFNGGSIALGEHYLSLLNSNVVGDVFSLALSGLGPLLTASALIGLALAIVFLLPNSLALLDQEKWGFPKLDEDIAGWPVKLRWQQTIPWALAIGWLGFLVLISLTSVSPFLYFQF